MQHVTEAAVSLRINLYALYLASRDTRVPGLAKLIVIVVVAYALSPIDLIPDFIPVIGYLDDAILLPLGVWLAIRLIPQDIWRECQARAIERAMELPRSRRTAAAIVGIWLLATAGIVMWLMSLTNPVIA
jgi:uncharacterized membrane protein YkvA (DUF1232 family)